MAIMLIRKDFKGGVVCDEPEKGGAYMTFYITTMTFGESHKITLEVRIMAIMLGT